MKILKALVIFLGVVLVGGFALLIYGFATRIPHAHPESARSKQPAGAFGTVAVPVPQGETVMGMVASGGRVVLRLGGTGGDRLVVLDPSSGRVVGQFVLTPEKTR